MSVFGKYWHFIVSFVLRFALLTCYRPPTVATSVYISSLAEPALHFRFLIHTYQSVCMELRKIILLEKWEQKLLRIMVRFISKNPPIYFFLIFRNILVREFCENEKILGNCSFYTSWKDYKPLVFWCYHGGIEKANIWTCFVFTMLNDQKKFILTLNIFRCSFNSSFLLKSEE